MKRKIDASALLDKELYELQVVLALVDLNPVARELRTPKYKPRVVRSKKRYQRAENKRLFRGGCDNMSH